MTPKNTGDCRTCTNADGEVCCIMGSLRSKVGRWGANHLEDDHVTRKPEAPPCPGYKERP